MDEIALALAWARTRAQLDDELAAQVRAFAAARAAPPAPTLTAAATGRVLRQALASPLAAEARPYAAAWAWAAVETDAGVVAARAQSRSWDGLARLTEARDRAAAQAGEGGLRALIAATLGAAPEAAVSDGAIAAAPIDPGARTAGLLPPSDAAALARALAALIAIHGGDARAVRCTSASAGRTFVIVPGREVVVAAPELSTVFGWQTALHELGHALVGLRVGPRPRRTIDEAIAQWSARHLEEPRWSTAALALDADAARTIAAIASRARTRQRAQHRLLAACERALLDGRDPAAAWRALALRAGWPEGADRVAPPDLYWDDPGAAIAYAAADDLAAQLADGDAWWTRPLPAWTALDA